MFRKRRTYLDWAASAPVSREAHGAFMKALLLEGNPSSPHEEGRAARSLLEEVRTLIARLASVKSDAVIFTSGATEANALAIVGQIDALLASGKSPGDLHVLYLPSAHASTQGALEELKERGVHVEKLTLSRMGIDLDALKAQLRPETVLVVLELICGETGVRFATRDVRRVLDAAGSLAHLHVDASQAPLEESFELTRLGAHTLSLDAQKVGAVRGIGALIAPRQTTIHPLMRGGGQERGLRPGTESPLLAASFAAALACAQEGMDAFQTRSRDMRAVLVAQLQKELPDLVLNEGKDQAMHILNLSLPGRDTDYIVALLDEAGFSVSTRSACATDEEGSRAVLALTGDPVRSASTLRISWGPSTKESDLLRFARALLSSVRFVDANGV